MAGINDLPIELYEKIFTNLSINDLLNCRLVDKKFKYSTYECVHKLMIVESENYDCLLNNDYWFYNNEPVYEDDIIKLKFFTKIESIFNLNKSLKHLRIHYLDLESYYYTDEAYREFLSNNLNNLINLESLEIYPSSSRQVNINLKNLKYLSVGRPYFNHQLNMTKLKKIEFDHIPNKSFTYPKSMKHLATFRFLDELKQFKNLEIIEIKHFVASRFFDELKLFKNLEIIELKSPSELDENLLSFFNNLKKFKINTFLGNWNNTSEKLIKILNDRIELNRDIDIYLYGVKILNIEKLKEIKMYEQKILDYQIKNYDLLDLNLSQIKELEFFKLNDHYRNLKNDLPSTFFDKYRNISCVCVSNDVRLQEMPVFSDNLKSFNSNDLVWFLNNLKCLKKLELKHIKLDENFLNNLPNTISHLTIRFVKLDQQDLISFLNSLKCLKRLKIIRTLSLDQTFFDSLPNTIRCLIIEDHYDPLSSLYSNINFDFILKFTKLIELDLGQINHVQPFDLVLKCFSNLKYFNEFRFNSEKMRSLSIRIIKSNNYYFFVHLTLEYEDEEDFSYGKRFVENFSYGSRFDKFDYDKFAVECRKYKSFLIDYLEKNK